MTHFTPSPTEQPVPTATRSIWFWLFAAVMPLVLFFAGLGLLSVMQGWYVPWSAPKEHPELQRTGTAVWLPKEKRADFERRIEVINQAIPAIEGELEFLKLSLKKEEARMQTNADAKEYVAFIRREQQFLADRIDELRSDRAFCERQLQEK